MTELLAKGVTVVIEDIQHGSAAALDVLRRTVDRMADSHGNGTLVLSLAGKAEKIFGRGRPLMHRADTFIRIGPWSMEETVDMALRTGEFRHPQRFIERTRICAGLPGLWRQAQRMPGQS